MNLHNDTQKSTKTQSVYKSPHPRAHTRRFLNEYSFLKTSLNVLNHGQNFPKIWLYSKIPRPGCTGVAVEIRGTKIGVGDNFATLKITRVQITRLGREIDSWGDQQ